MTAQRPSQQPRSRRPPSPPSPRGPVPASADLPNPGFYGSDRFPSCCRVLALRLLQHGAAQCEAGAGGVAPVDPGRSRLPGLRAIALQTRMHGPALIVDEPAFAQGVESPDHNGAPPNTKSPVPRSSAERVVSLVDGRPPMRPVLRARSLPGPSPALGGLQCATGFDPPCATRPGEEVLPRAR